MNNTILDPALHRLTSRVWTCPGAPYTPGCPGGEVYADLTGTRFARECLFREAIVRCDEEFGASVNRRPRLWLGLSPLTIRNKAGSIDIYLAAHSNRNQHRYQCAHEVFHARSGPNVRHWTHEMLAVHFSLLHLRAEGHDAYADAEEQNLLHDATQMSTAELLGWSRWPDYPPVPIYGRVFVLGRELIAAASWKDVKLLVSADLQGWLASLGKAKRGRVHSVLGA